MLAVEFKTQIETHAIDHATERLIRRYAGRHDAETVRAAVRLVSERYATAEVHAFVPVLVERDVRRLLDTDAER
ncbi:three-helix bundle dimerization domain-containing protein [Dactylosporangium sp. CA-233914]|uniref:three-helix bundle dimerization domain-containing protein n=1 Tax=Dactylosporangium sp. CA-233914 TaxID=3239934 RepID=UPI003D9144FA